ncbi:MAG TPA: hypothetical protein DEO86_12735 [Colwellia sp.]|nr:hypothetical protein [Colwellia sp.]|tara:strand:- start:1852 stop:2316 length:465 start_codon:yes stop_codon:yes gene_type:complete
MIDYREELDFRMALVIFLVRNFATNKNDKKILTIDKLRLLILICLTPKKLNNVSKKLNNKEISYLQNVFYDDSSSRLDVEDLKEISILMAYMCKLNYLQIEQEDSKYIVAGSSLNDFSDEVSQSAPQYLSKNVRLIKLISAKSESLITKALMEA